MARAALPTLLVITLGCALPLAWGADATTTPAPTTAAPAEVTPPATTRSAPAAAMPHKIHTRMKKKPAPAAVSATQASAAATATPAAATVASSVSAPAAAATPEPAPAAEAAPAATPATAPAPAMSGAMPQMPVRGMDMANVEHIFGTPLEKQEAVGKPPITRWVYADYVVYFEYNKVLHSVLKAAPFSSPGA